MKKLMMLLAFCGLTTAVFAQEEEVAEESYPTLKHKYVTNGFWDNWFIDAGVTHLSSYSNGEHGLGLKKNPFWTGRRNWGGELSIGKWATPAFGMRVKGQAAWATQVVSPTGPENPTYKQFSVSFQPMLNLTNLFGGYKPRWWEISLYGGAGFMRDCTFDSYGVITDLGVINTWNITKRFHINLDVYARMGEFDQDGDEGGAFKTSHSFLKSRDCWLGFSAGVGVNLGKVGWDNAPDMDAILANHKNQIDALNNSISNLEAENADLRNKLAQKPKEVVKTVTVGEFATTSASVFFDINKSEIASKKDLVNVKELAEYAKSNDKTVVVTGFADSATGSAAYNQTLSEKRAQAVADALVNMGVSRDKIETSGQGGVNDLTPESYNRRAVVTLK